MRRMYSSNLGLFFCYFEGSDTRLSVRVHMVHREPPAVDEAPQNNEARALRTHRQTVDTFEKKVHNIHNLFTCFCIA